MYNKLFTKILDSSIWLAPDPHRLVWITFLAAMDEDGNAMFASAANVAARARVTREQAESAIAAFEGPDPDSGDPENEGRRIERFPGGWHVLNAAKYRALVTKAIIREQTRIRVARHREKNNAAVTHEKREANAPVTPSVSEARAEAEAKNNNPPTPRKRGSADGFDDFWSLYPRKENKAKAAQAFARIRPDAEMLSAILAALRKQAASEQWTRDGGQYIPHPTTWLNGRRWEDQPPEIAAPRKADRLMAGNIAAAREFLAATGDA